MSTPVTATEAPHRGSEDARARLLQAGLQLFAHQGFAKTSTRELAEAASVNVASISYYFGDKAGLYRAVFTEPMGPPEADIARFDGAQLGLAEALHGFYAGFIEPLRHGEAARLCMKLHYREMLEPTGLCDAAAAHGIKPIHDALVVMLARQLGLAQADLELERLAICLAGLGVHLHTGRDVIDQLAPALNQADSSLDDWAERLVMFGLAMVRAEAARRGLSLQGV